MNKPFAQACEENKGPILAVLAPRFRDCRRVLEIGSGTGQHAVHFAAALPDSTWQTSDLPEALPGIRAWLAAAGLPNTPPPLALDVLGAWPEGPFDGAFSANTAHIMPAEAVAAMLKGLGRALAPGGRFALYGPFSYGGEHTSESNARFDTWLKARDPAMGVRDLDELTRWAAAAGLALTEDIAMPVNNRTLIWERATGTAEAGPA